MYNDKAQLLIDNPINRYLINSPILPSMKKDADGGLTTILLPKRRALCRQEGQLAAGSQRPDLHGDAALQAEKPPSSILPSGEGTWKPPAVLVPQ
jgi:hypothetical protein